MSRPRRAKSRPLPAKQPLQKSGYQALAKIIRTRATELGLSVRSLAARLRKPRTTVHKTLCGDRRLDPIEFLDWCEALEFDDPLVVINSARRR
ncbi:MAG: XRE family transcriptional regulator [Planctomycetes bacterium]|nr:XRE family transcriptional regulator [Planctomycetota bacterium]